MQATLSAHSGLLRLVLCLVVTAMFSASVGATTIQVFEENFDGPYTPAVDASFIVVETIGSGNLNNFASGGSAAGGDALALNDDDQIQTETIAVVDLSSYALADLTLHFSAAAESGDFESTQIDTLAVLLNGTEAVASRFDPAGTSNSSLTNGSATLGFTFQDFAIPFSSFSGLTQASLSNLQVQVQMGASSTTEHMGIDTVRITATPQAAIPEPVSMVLIGMGGLAVLMPRRRR